MLGSEAWAGALPSVLSVAQFVFGVQSFPSLGAETCLGERTGLGRLSSKDPELSTKN